MLGKIGGNYLTPWEINGYKCYWRDNPERLVALIPRLTDEEIWPGESPHILVSKGSSWQHHGGSEPDASWTTTSFDPTTWPVGHGESDIATEAPFGPDAKWAATYSRHTFSHHASKPLKKLRIKARRDDGCAVFLNGQLLFKHHLPASTPARWGTYADSEVGGIEEELYYLIDIEPKNLSTDNALAIQIHQCNGKSSNIALDLTLEGLLN